jgi:hypothetical protein
MSSRKKIVADLLFGVQIASTFVWGGAQFVRMLTTSQGVSVSWFGFWELFLVLNLMLALRAHKTQPSRVTRQTIATYSLWTLIVSMDLGVMVVRGTTNWNERDVMTTIFATLGIVATLAVARAKSFGIVDPVVKGWLGASFKGIPQLGLAYNLMTLGANGLAGMTILTGHITVLTRLGQLYFSIREAGWDRNRTGSAISELANYGSWVIVTIAWFFCQQ